MSETQKTAQTQNLNGLYIHGTLLSAEPTASGRNSDMQWGASIKLNFLAQFSKTSMVKGVAMDSNASRLITISISSTDDLLPNDLDKYKKLEGQHVTMNLEPQKNSTFKLLA